MTAGRWGAWCNNAWDYGRFALLAGTAFLPARAGAHGLAGRAARASRLSGVSQRQLPGRDA